MRTSLLAIVIATVVAPVAAQAQGQARWTGYYVGAHADRIWGDNDVAQGCENPTPPFFDGTANCSQIIANGAFSTSISTDLEGYGGGVQAGYNSQSGNIVFGIEADISALSADDTESITTNVPSFFPETLTASQDLRWLATVRARAGYAMGNWLLFATGGFAFGKVDYSYSFNCPSCGANVVASSADSSTETGWTAGGGAEYAFGRWSLKGEYLYFDLGDQNFRAEPTADGTPVSSFGFNWHNTANFETAGSIARVALNYHLD